MGDHRKRILDVRLEVGRNLEIKIGLASTTRRRGKSSLNFISSRLKIKIRKLLITRRENNLRVSVKLVLLNIIVVMESP